MNVWDDAWDLYDSDYHGQDDERVLVAVVTHPRDWHLVCSQHWYRIPLAHAPRRVGADYLAFYHTKPFGELRWTITFYAPVRRYSLVHRRDLLPSEPDHPRANALYYKIEIGRLEALPCPIPSRRLRRVTFIMTTKSCLFRAQEISDLWVRRKAGDHLWRAWKCREPANAAWPVWA